MTCVEHDGATRDGRRGRNLQSFVEFVLDTMLEASAAHEQSENITCCLTPVKLECLRHCSYVNEEVADIWAHWVAHTFGATFWNEGIFLEFPSRLPAV